MKKFLMPLGTKQGKKGLVDNEKLIASNYRNLLVMNVFGGRFFPLRLK